jgi:hypothetical protein
MNAGGVCAVTRASGEYWSNVVHCAGSSLSAEQ